MWRPCFPVEAVVVLLGGRLTATSSAADGKRSCGRCGRGSKHLGPPDSTTRPVHQISGGERQLVLFGSRARAGTAIHVSMSRPAI